MQQAVLPGLALAALLAALACTAGAGEPQDARVAAARALFTADNGIGAAGEGRASASTASAAPAPRRELDGQRGAGTHNDMALGGTVAANTAVNVASGANSIDAGSFANMAGIPVVIQNSGANVLIQNATIINLQFK